MIFMAFHSDSDSSLSGSSSHSPLRDYSLPDHKVIGVRYLALSLAAGLAGMVLSLVLRGHLVWPSAHVPFLSGIAVDPARYAAFTMLHGSLMVFFVLTVAPQAGFGNYLLPLQIGARDMALPGLSVLSFWLTVTSLLGIVAAFWLPAAPGLALWTASVAIFCFSAVLTSINFIVTALDLRAKGMTLPRMPLTVWAWFLDAILSMLIFSILLAACTFLLSDLLAGSHFFSSLDAVAGESPALSNARLFSLWQRLFWFFVQAEVYVAMLPCFGIVSHVLATFSRKRVWRERSTVLALGAVGLFGFCVWGQHMFSSGLNPWSPLAFSVLASSLGLPAAVLICSWFGTVWKSRIRSNTSMLFALGFIALFVAGGLSGILLARKDLVGISAGEEALAGHFHLVMGVAATFAILAALFFWFPKMFGRRLSETLGKLHFWLTFVGVYCVFAPMLWTRFAALPSEIPAGRFVSVAAIFTVAAQGIFLFNVVWSFFCGALAAENNPWRSATLEWTVTSPPPRDNFGKRDVVVFRGAYEFNSQSTADDFALQTMSRAPWEQSTKDRPLRAKFLET